MLGRSRKRSGKKSRGVKLSSIELPDEQSVRRNVPNDLEFISFSKQFVRHVNDYNASHGNYPCTFVLGLVREIYGSDRWLSPCENLGMWVFPDGTKEDVMDDNTSPDFEKQGRNIRTLKSFYCNEYFPHRDDPDVYDKLAGVWFECHARPYFKEAGIRPGVKPAPVRNRQSVRTGSVQKTDNAVSVSIKENPLHRVPGTDIWRRYGDPVPASIRSDSMTDEMGMI